jgi:hypothetical protein
MAADGELLATMKATRERSRQSVEAGCRRSPPADLQALHLRRSELGQWWTLQASRRIHFAQLREVKATPGSQS